MKKIIAPDGAPWPRAKFPGRARREAFLSQVRLWNRLDDGGQLEVVPLPDGVGVKFHPTATTGERLLGLIESFGGRLTFELGSGLRALMARRRSVRRAG